MSDRLFQSIAEQITDLIRTGEFAPGTRLPGERELAERFAVSRVTIREAEIALQAVGVIKIKTGSGVYVADTALAESKALPNVSAFEVTEARALFESEAAALAAPIVSDAVLARLDSLVATMAEETDPDSERASAADREFHLAIASASGNRAIIHVIGELWRLRNELPEVRSTHEAVCHKDVSTRAEEHARVVAALHARDPQAARLAMRQHFHRLQRAMLDVTEEREISELKRKSAESRERFMMSARI
ncbi:MAG: FadR/GntR family transcriptional regulator [Pseudomonadota bacterium]